MELPFAKLQGAGNGYIAIDGRDVSHDWPALARVMTDSHFGVGSDGLLVVESSDVAHLRMRIFNSDGSESEMSGNGIRLFAKFALDRGLAVVDDGTLRIETGGGVRTLWPQMRDGSMVGARVAMGAPSFEPEKIKRLLGVIDRILADGRDYLAGPYSIGDIMHFPWLQIMKNLGSKEITELDRVSSWLERIEKRPEVQKGMSIPG